MSADRADRVDVTIRVLERQYVVSCFVEEREALLAAAREMNRRMQERREKGKVLAPERMAVMTALNVIYEYEALKSEYTDAMNLAQEQVQPLENTLDAALDRHERARARVKQAAVAQSPHGGWVSADSST